MENEKQKPVIMTDAERRGLEEYIREEITGISSLKKLNEAVGGITPEEQEMIKAVHLDVEPTDEELKALGPDFLDRINRRVSKTRFANAPIKKT